MLTSIARASEAAIWSCTLKTSPNLRSKALDPALGSVGSVNKLCCDTNLVARAAHRSFNDIACA